MKRIIEFWAMVGNHNLYRGDELVIDWNEHNKGFDNGDVVALCSDGNLFWIDLPTSEEVDELIYFS